VQGLADRSRRPYRYAHQLPFQVENYILNVKHEHPSWGARKISGTKAHSQVILSQHTVGKERRRPVKLGNDFRAGHGQTLASPNVERNSFPAPGADLQLHGGEGFRL
jgi:hypothetical protein